MSTQNILKVDNVTMQFGGVVALSDFSLELKEGELAGLIGPNGAGKTTAFNVITGIYKPTKGKVYFEGKDITGLRPDKIAALGIARTFQNIRLFSSLSVLDNVLVASHVRLRSSPWEAIARLPKYNQEEELNRQEAMELLEAVGLAGVANEQAGGLPYGQQRRLEIARALATRPKVLLLDEPGAGMSVEEINDLMGFIRRILRDFGLTILLIEHQMRLVMGICQWIQVLNYGRTIAKGTPLEIQNNPQVIEAYLGGNGNA